MSHTRAKLAEAVALLSTLAAIARAQTVEPVPVPEGMHSSGRDGVAISRDGRWVVAGFEGDFRHLSVLVSDGASSTLLGPVVTSMMTKVLITDVGGVYADLWPWGWGPRPGEWTSTGFVPLTQNPAYLCDASADGSTVLVQGWTVDSPGLLVGRGGEVIRSLAPALADWYTWFHAVNDDASVVVASSEAPRPTYYLPQVYRAGVRHELPHQGWPGGGTADVSGDGRVIAGMLWSGLSQYRAALWIDDAGPFLLGPLGSYSMVLADGGRRVAISTSDARGTQRLWSPSGGLQTLAELGFSPGDSDDVVIDAMSSDGRRAVGRVSVPVPAWVTINLPAPCHLDYATDGFVDFFDYLAFVDCFLGDCPNYRSADFNFDGFVDWTDYADFVDAFEAGC